jgi:hypothetical protein
MPGWYLHMEAAHQAVERLRAGHVPRDFPPGVDAHALGEITHKWRNYLALGAIGPDIAALFPNFKPPVGHVLVMPGTPTPNGVGYSIHLRPLTIVRHAPRSACRC